MKKYILVDRLGVSNDLRTYDEEGLAELVKELIEIKQESDPSFTTEGYTTTEQWLDYFNYEIKEAKVLTVEQLEEVYTDLSDTVSMEEELDWIAEGTLFEEAMRYYYNNAQAYEKKWGANE